SVLTAPTTGDALDLYFDTDNLLLRVIDFTPGQFQFYYVSDRGFYNGVQVFISPIGTGNNIAQFRFAGDLVIPNGSTISASGIRGVSLFAANDVTVGTGVTFNFSAILTQAGPGGGQAGTTAGQGGGAGAAGSGGAAGSAGGGGARGTTGFFIHSGSNGHG